MPPRRAMNERRSDMLLIICLNSGQIFAVASHAISSEVEHRCAMHGKRISSFNDAFIFEPSSVVMGVSPITKSNSLNIDSISLQRLIAVLLCSSKCLHRKMACF